MIGRIAVLVCALLCFATSVQAHKVRIFAYMEDGEIVCEANFSGGKACKGCPITVSDAANGRKIVEDKTGEDGVLRLPLPEGAKDALYGMKLVVNGGEGHRGEWLLDPEEYLEVAAAAPEPATTETAPEPAETRSMAAEQIQQAKERGQASYDEEVLRRVVSEVIASQVGPAVDKSLERKLGPIRRQLADATDQGPTFTSILGGLGWIIGMAGIVAWMRSRRDL